MTRNHTVANAACVALSSCCLSLAQPAPTPPPAEPNTALVPVPKLEQDSYDWYQRHEDVLAVQAKINPLIVLIGDSITHFWAGEPRTALQNGPLAWKATFGDLPVLNLGFGWDRTQNVLWRLDHGEFAALHPRKIVLNIGTNNFSATANARANTPAEIAEGILAICARLQAKSPAAAIIVMGVLPRGHDANDPWRAKIGELNRILAERLKPLPGVSFLDIAAQMLAADGTLPKEVMPDGTHPSEKGYAIWGKALVAAGVRD
jgi:lysophospholipase L1-like esterase